MNLLGPCLNPARPPVQLLGVAEPRLLRPVAETLRALGVERALVVHGSGLDEVALHGFTEAVRLTDGHARGDRNHARAGGPRAAPGRGDRGRLAGRECRAAPAIAGGRGDRGPRGCRRAQCRRAADDRGASRRTCGRRDRWPRPRSRSGAAGGCSTASSRRAMAEGILGEIVAAKQRGAGAEVRRRVARRASGQRAPDASQPCRRRSRGPAPASSSRSRRPRRRKASIRRGADVAALARGYAPVADALSVLTDSAFLRRLAR